MTTINAAPITVAPDQLLRRVLQANMVFSSLSGLLLAVDAGPLSRWLGVPAAWMLVVIKVGLWALPGNFSRRPDNAQLTCVRPMPSWSWM